MIKRFVPVLIFLIIWSVLFFSSGRFASVRAEGQYLYVGGAGVTASVGPTVKIPVADSSSKTPLTISWLALPYAKCAITVDGSAITQTPAMSLSGGNATSAQLGVGNHSVSLNCDDKPGINVITANITTDGSDSGGSETTISSVSLQAAKTGGGFTDNLSVDPTEGFTLQSSTTGAVADSCVITGSGYDSAYSETVNMNGALARSISHSALRAGTISRYRASCSKNGVSSESGEVVVTVSSPSLAINTFMAVKIKDSGGNVVDSSQHSTGQSVSVNTSPFTVSLSWSTVGVGSCVIKGTTEVTVGTNYVPGVPYDLNQSFTGDQDVVLTCKSSSTLETVSATLQFRKSANGGTTPPPPTAVGPEITRFEGKVSGSDSDTSAGIVAGFGDDLIIYAGVLTPSDVSYCQITSAPAGGVSPSTLRLTSAEDLASYTRHIFTYVSVQGVSLNLECHGKNGAISTRGINITPKSSIGILVNNKKLEKISAKSKVTLSWYVGPDYHDCQFWVRDAYTGSNKKVDSVVTGTSGNTQYEASGYQVLTFFCKKPGSEDIERSTATVIALSRNIRFKTNPPTDGIKVWANRYGGYGEQLGTTKTIGSDVGVLDVPDMIAGFYHFGGTGGNDGFGGNTRVQEDISKIIGWDSSDTIEILLPLTGSRETHSSLRGKVTDQTTQKPVGGVMVCLFEKPADGKLPNEPLAYQFTNEDGEYSFDVSWKITDGQNTSLLPVVSAIENNAWVYLKQGQPVDFNKKFSIVKSAPVILYTPSSNSPKVNVMATETKIDGKFSQQKITDAKVTFFTLLDDGSKNNITASSDSTFTDIALSPGVIGKKIHLVITHKDYNTIDEVITLRPTSTQAVSPYNFQLTRRTKQGCIDLTGSQIPSEVKNIKKITICGEAKTNLEDKGLRPWLAFAVEVSNTLGMYQTAPLPLLVIDKFIGANAQANGSRYDYLMVGAPCPRENEEMDLNYSILSGIANPGLSDAKLKEMAMHETTHIVDSRSLDCQSLSNHGDYGELFESLVPANQKKLTPTQEKIQEFFGWLTDPWEYRDLGSAEDLRRYNQFGLSKLGGLSDELARLTRRQEFLAQVSILYNFKIDGKLAFRSEMIDRLKNVGNEKRVEKLKSLGITGNREYQAAFDKAVPKMEDMINQLNKIYRAGVK